MSQLLPDVPLLGWGVPDEDVALQPFNIHSNAFVSSLVVKTGPGILYGFTVYNSKVAAQFIQIFDAVSLPANGAIPACVFTAATVANLGTNWIPGRTFTTGCVIANSSTAPTLTIGSADCFIDAQYV